MQDCSADVALEIMIPLVVSRTCSPMVGVRAAVREKEMERERPGRISLESRVVDFTS
jgi:hypothetical protein